MKEIKFFGTMLPSPAVLLVIFSDEDETEYFLYPTMTSLAMFLLSEDPPPLGIKKLMQAEKLCPNKIVLSDSDKCKFTLYYSLSSDLLQTSEKSVNISDIEALVLHALYHVPMFMSIEIESKMAPFKENPSLLEFKHKKERN